MVQNKFPTPTANAKKERISWYFYDFANSVFSTTVISVFLGPYFTALAESTANSFGKISFFGIHIAAGSFYPIIVAISVILQVLVLPFFASIADNTRFKKHILFTAAYIGAISTLCLFFVDASNYLFGAILFIIANICFGLSCAVYNSYLNHIAQPEETTKLSSIGWATGYIGGGLLLLANLLFYQNAETFGIEKNLAIRICLASAGVWWGIFSLIPLRYLRQIYPTKQPTSRRTILTLGIKILWQTIKDARNYQQTLLFLLAYMLYNDGVQSIILLAAQFGSAELGLQMETLIICILLVQFIAFFGAIIFNFIAKKFGDLPTLKATLLIWIGVVIFAYTLLYTKYDFYFLCCCVGIIMGATQALSRSIYSQLIPKGKETAYFSIYELSEKGTSWLGPVVFAIIYNATFSYRLAILSLILFFILGFIILLKFNFKLGKNILITKIK